MKGMDMKEYIFYKHKVLGPLEHIDEQHINLFKTMVNSGSLDFMPDTPYLNDDMKAHPDEIHILQCAINSAG